MCDPTVSSDVSPTPSVVDLSRRSNPFLRTIRSDGSCDVAGVKRRQFVSRSYFFFLTRRVFFAVFFTADFDFLAFFAFLAFLAMLPSKVSEMAYLCVHSGNRNALQSEYTNAFKKTSWRLRKCLRRKHRALRTRASQASQRVCETTSHRCKQGTR
jgi:hypothetical protein